jgi:hypothetical protein
MNSPARTRFPGVRDIDTSSSTVSSQHLVDGTKSPRPAIDPERLSYHLLRPREAGPADVPVLGVAYECWRSVWKEFLLERDKAGYLPSDDFTRQDEIGVLFHGWECIGMTFHRRVDLSNAIYADDSCFRVWPRSVLDAACAAGKRLFIVGNLTVPPRWRNAQNISVKRVVGALAIERYLKSDADTLVATMRNDRNMNKGAFELGFELIHEGVMLHGCPCDLVAFYRGKSRRLPLNEANEAVVRSLCP